MKPIFKSGDGSEHESQESAILRDELLVACRRHDEAVENVCRTLGANALTADGKHCDSRKLNRFWYLVYWNGWPHLRELNVYWYASRIEHQEYSGESHLVIKVDRDDSSGSITYKINELYASKKSAEAALIKACEEKLEDYAIQLKKLKEKAN